jgi:uncharacterized protein
MTASAQRAAEPSMEEILASIRRIIADDKARTRTGPAKLVSVSEAPAEKLVSEAPAPEFERTNPELARGQAVEAHSFGEGREAFSAAALPAHPTEELEQSAPVSEESTNPVEERRSAKASPSFNSSGGTINSLRPLPHDAHALSMSTYGEGARRAQFQTAQTPQSRGVPQDSRDGPPEVSAAIEAGQGGDADADLSHAPLPLPESARNTAQPEIFPDLSSPSPRLAQACADLGGAARMTELPGSRPQRRSEEEVAAMLSSEADRAVTRAFGDLNRGVLSQNAHSLEDVVKEMLRPLLKAWLDDNLPRIVERLVRMEIERVARGRAE